MTTQVPNVRESRRSRAAQRTERFSRLRATALSTCIFTESPSGVSSHLPVIIAGEEGSPAEFLADMTLPPPLPQQRIQTVDDAQTTAPAVSRQVKVETSGIESELKESELKESPSTEAPSTEAPSTEAPLAPLTAPEASSPKAGVSSQHEHHPPDHPTLDQDALEQDASGHASDNRSKQETAESELENTKTSAVFRIDDKQRPFPPPPLALPAFSLARTSRPKVMDRSGTIPVEGRYRELRRNALAHLPAGEPATLVWVNPTGSEETGAHLAEFALALSETCAGDILLVDANLNSASLTRHFNLIDKPGLAEVLAKKLHCHAAAQDTAMARIRVLPRGGDAASRLLRRVDDGAWKSLLSSLKQRYRYLLVDAPGVEEPHCLSLAKAADAVFLVIGLDYTPRETVQEALGALELHKAPVIGCVLTDAPS